MAILTKSTVYQRSFLMVLSSDGKSPATGKTVTVNLSKAGGAFGAAAGAVSEISLGWYSVALTTVDTGTLGDLAGNCTATGCDNTDFCDQVGPPAVNVVQALGTAPTCTTAGILDVNAKNINNVSTVNVTTINANLGTTQAITFDSNDYQKVDLVDIAGTAVSATTAQLGVNVVNWNNTVVATPATAGIPDINVKNIVNAAAVIDGNNYLKVDVVDIAGTASAGTAGYMAPDWGHVNAPTSAVGLTGTTIGTLTTYTGNTVQTGDAYARLGAPAGRFIEADIASIKTDTHTAIPALLPTALTANGNMKCSLVEILTTALTETTGYLAAGFKKFFNVASPTSTMNEITLVDTATAVTDAVVLPSIPSNWITAAGINAAAMNGKGDWGTATNLATANTNISDIVTLLGIPANVTVSADIAALLVAVDAASPPAATAIADAVLTRASTHWEGSAPPFSLGAAVMGQLNWSISGSTLTISTSTGATIATYTITSGAANPITGIS